MSLDAELEQWSSAWQSAAAVPPDLRQCVKRQSRWMRIMMAADILVTVVIGGGVTTLAVRAPQPAMVLLAAATWLFIAAAWAFALKVNRGLWAPAAVDTATFIELSIRRCRARLASTVFGAGLFVCEMAFCLGWIYRYSAHHMPWLAWLFLGLATLAFFAALVWYRRRKRAELAWLLKIASGERPLRR